MFGNGIVFIPSLGMAVSGDNILSPISLRYEVRNRFRLEKDESTMFTNPELAVTRNIEVDSIATIVIIQEAEIKGGSAAEINSGLLASMVENIKANRALAEELAKEDEEDEKPKRGRRGRKSKAEKEAEEEDEEDDEDEDDDEDEAPSEEELLEALAKKQINYVAYDIIVDRVVIEDSSIVPMSKSAPYRIMAGKKPKVAEALSNNLARLRKSVAARGEALNNLQSGSFDGAEAIDDATADMVPSLDKNLRGIDEAGLKNYETKLRGDITATEDRIRGLYDFFEQKVVGKVNEESKVLKAEPFVDAEITVAGTAISRAEILAKLFSEELQPIAFGTKTPVKK